MNLSLLTSDFFSVVIAVFLFSASLSPLYYIAFAVIVVGLIIFNVAPERKESTAEDIALVAAVDDAVESGVGTESRIAGVDRVDDCDADADDSDEESDGRALIRAANAADGVVIDEQASAVRAAAPFAVVINDDIGASRDGD